MKRHPVSLTPFTQAMAFAFLLSAAPLQAESSLDPLNANRGNPAHHKDIILVNHFGGEFRTASIEKKAELRDATFLKGLLSYAVTPWLSVNPKLDFVTPGVELTYHFGT